MWPARIEKSSPLWVKGEFFDTLLRVVMGHMTIKTVPDCRNIVACAQLGYCHIGISGCPTKLVRFREQSQIISLGPWRWNPLGNFYIFFSYWNIVIWKKNKKNNVWLFDTFFGPFFTEAKTPQNIKPLDFFGYLLAFLKNTYTVNYDFCKQYAKQCIQNLPYLKSVLHIMLLEF